ncbi:hypothetical protein D3C76_545960 [compost metagenome]
MYTNSPFSKASSSLIVFISSKPFISFTYPIILLASPSVTCPPSGPYTLYPLYCFGLWDAVTTIPPEQFKCLTANDNTGVGSNTLNKYTFIPFPHKVKAADLANSTDIFLES